MAVEKGKVLAAIELKFKGKSISKTFKENIAAKWAEKIDNDTDIDGYIDDREDVVLETVREADTRVTEAVKKAKGNPDPKPEPTLEPEIPTDAPDYVKVIMAKLDTVTTELNTFKTGQTQQTIAQRFNSDPRVKDIPEFIRNGYVPQSEDDFEAKAEALKTAYTGFAEQNKINMMGKDNPGGSGTGGAADGRVKPASEAEVAEVMKGL